MKKKGMGIVDRDIEFLDRMSRVTEELEDLVQITKGQRNLQGPVVSKDEILRTFLKEKRPVAGISRSILGIFRLLVVKNLMQGRLFGASYTSGKEIGRSSTARSRKDLIKVARRIGMGNVKIIAFDPDNIKLKLYKGITAVGIKHSKRPICFFEAGVFAGLLENIFRKRIDLREVRCRAMGSPHCLFELNPSLRMSSSSDPNDSFSEENLKLLTSLASHAITAIENTALFEKTRQQTIIDGLTQVFNRRYFQFRILNECKRAQRYDSHLTLFMIDIDNFKKINDKYGHPVGDDVLKMVASKFVENLRDVDVISRYGGDEFAIIAPQTDDRGAMIVAERLRKVILKSKIKTKHKNIHVTISLGAATLGKSSLKNCPNIVEIADKALLAAKYKGRNNAVLVKKG